MFPVVIDMQYRGLADRVTYDTHTAKCYQSVVSLQVPQLLIPVSALWMLIDEQIAYVFNFLLANRVSSFSDLDSLETDMHSNFQP